MPVSPMLSTHASTTCVTVEKAATAFCPAMAQASATRWTSDDLPATHAALAEAKPVMEYLPGWGCDISNARKFGDLPAAARDYVRYVEDTLRTPIPYVSVGAARDAIILR